MATNGARSRAGRIRPLSETLISQIAAGEVVERPASVVKELVENALDASAGRVEIELEGGGRALIAVRDDGRGMDEEDARLAFDRHATSKIATFDDLEGVSTLGFRGEALAAIAAVARVELVTATAEAAAGTRIVVEGGERQPPEPAPRAPGTDVEVRSLFYNVPVRRRFLKRPSTELRRATEVVQGYALAHPEVYFRLVHDGRELLDLPPRPRSLDGMRRRIEDLFGESLAGHLVALPDDAVANGFVGDRETTRGRRLFTFVNGRLLRDRSLLAIFYRGVRDLWHGEDYPALFLFLDVPPHEVDVNVHPQKAEVRFRDRAILGQVGRALRLGLEAARGEEPAPLRPIDPETRPTSFAWSGAGGRHSESPFGGGSTDGGAHGVAEVRYRPWQARGAVLSGRRGEERTLRVLGQYKGSLVLVEGPDALYVVDQHAAHERVLYERFRTALGQREVESQPLLVSEILELGPAEAQALAELAESLQAFGYSLEPLSARSLALRAIPAGLRREEAERALLGLAAEAAESGDREIDLAARLLDNVAASSACRGAVKIHHPMSLDEAERLISDLFAAEQPYTCPHGRPTILKLDDTELERRFGRRG